MGHQQCEKINEVAADVQMMMKEMYGNGKDGLVKTVDAHDTYIDRQIGSAKMLKYLIRLSGFNAIALASTLIGILYTIIKKGI